MQRRMGSFKQIEQVIQHRPQNRTAGEEPSDIFDKWYYLSYTKCGVLIND